MDGSSDTRTWPTGTVLAVSLKMKDRRYARAILKACCMKLRLERHSQLDGRLNNGRLDSSSEWRHIGMEAGAGASTALY
jgi:hypothetical protein